MYEKAGTAMKDCPNLYCREKLPPNARFCRKCGTRIS
ncbi:MAG: zinc-ribbon domain-containing protein [Candidatus Aminicenantes bacterium]|nr:zinc-ribbon domain-containing protein [Candidatus Aminicenantes bacterium]NIM83893.1 zinc-ribbon domain-containing protein [Candidatus Aminicenantes bacterium]NIN23359.1 zinc-ribbon domain-containing protein [Candidatus Aminicenantes bacterium]NIN47061.1 zinc-ribbon domain-containing protein [Candidatus Aminicenantes bacterium]NIN89985.1 zinc-ribbon domain-containing protein [Candidatus Aminicenantes bacterium]